jgi:DNA polymerase III subunit epsilon
MVQQPPRTAFAGSAESRAGRITMNKQKEIIMLGQSRFDPPADPEGNVRVCLQCDQSLAKDLVGEWICINRRCKDSTAYDFIFDAHESAREWASEVLKHPERYVILDTETTGLGNADQVVQVAMISGAGEVLINNLLIKPTIPIPTGASKIHGITDEVVEHAPDFIDVWLEIHKHMQGKRLVIYNAEFDLRMLRQSAAGCGHTIEFPFLLCTCAMTTYAEWVGEWNEYHGSFKWQKLPGGDHSALGDCFATLDVIKEMSHVPRS